MTTDSTPLLSPVPYERFVADVETVAAALAADNWRPDHLVGIGRGGLVPAAYLSHRTGLPMLSVDLSAGLKPFADGLLGELAAMCARGGRILFIDDINDSGATILGLGATMRRLGAPAGYRFAVLIDNSRSPATVAYRARTIDRATDKAWFVFPWEQGASPATLAAEALEVPGRLG